jgi:asparagine synthase (glutamine-hydrolysing)
VCGISLALDPAAPATLAARVRRMHERGRHRGPDGEGFFALDPGGRAHASLDAGPASLAIAFRRLRVLDLGDAASQPMASAEGRCVLAFNGEIYNYRALRDELRGRGRAFLSTGDTEVLLAAYEEWGEGCFARLDGMWAAAIVDRGRGRLVLSRDRFGIKPLHWAIDGGTLLVASEAKQVVAALRGRPRANRPLLATYLAGNRYPCLDETFFEGVQAVPPATWAAVPLQAPPAPPSFRPYWSLADHRAPADGDYRAAGERFADLLRDAVRTHAVADVPVGALLSGGLDSSSLAATLAAVSGAHHPTFSFGIRGAAGGLDELPYAEAVARAHGLANHQAGMDGAWVARRGPAAIAAMDEPPLALPALAQYRTFELCREHGATVVLDGQGADEVLGGYPYHQRVLLADRIRRRRFGAAAREMAAIARREHVATARVAAALALPVVARRLRRRPRWLAEPPARDSAAVRHAVADRGRDPSALNRQLYWDVRWGNVKIVLGYTDRNAMAHSVEARVPFFDRALVEFAFAQPDHFKVGGGQRKRILRDVARAFLPPEVTERPVRMGFAAPAGPLLDGLRSAARPAVEESGLLADRLVRPREARALLERFAAGAAAPPDEVFRLWAAATWARELAVDLG